jgi:cob(I)alamin adenosyltransferase
VAVMCHLFSEEELLALIDMKPDNVELVITGRGATKLVMDKADLVTEMKEIKHYYKQGVVARVGIEK